MKRFLPILVAFFCASAAVAGGALEDDVHTLYRNSLTDRNMRIHVATFDTADGGSYNHENCALAAKLFQSQPGVKTKFWCEKGRFKQ